MNNSTELKPEVFMNKMDLHGEIRNKYWIVNKQNNSLCALTANESGTKMLPAVFNSKKDAEFYLSFIDEKDCKDCIIRFSKIAYFDNGAVLLGVKTEYEMQDVLLREKTECNMQDVPDIKDFYPFAVGDRYNYTDYNCNGTENYYKILIKRKKELTRRYKYYYRIKIKKIKYPTAAKEVYERDWYREVGYNYALECDYCSKSWFRVEALSNPNNLEFNSDYALCMLNDKYLNSQIYAVSEQLCYINANLKKIRQHNSNVHKKGTKCNTQHQLFRDTFKDVTSNH